MTNIKKVDIPQTCHQPWQQMGAVEDGRHCEHCCKTVVDFTTMTNEQIISYLSVKQDLCGRFNQHQLDSLNTTFIHKDYHRFLWKSILAGVSMLSMFPFFKTEAKSPPPTVQITSSFKDTIHDFIVKGRVVFGKGSLPIKGARISVKGTNTITTTDKNGDFAIQVSSKEDVLVGSANGYNSQLIPLTGNLKKPLKIIMNEYVEVMGMLEL